MHLSKCDGPYLVWMFIAYNDEHCTLLLQALGVTLLSNSQRTHSCAPNMQYSPYYHLILPEVFAVNEPIVSGMMGRFQI